MFSAPLAIDRPPPAAGAGLGSMLKSPIRFLRTWSFRVVLVYMTLFGVSVLLMLGFIYETTVGFIDRQIQATIMADTYAVSERYRDAGLDGVVEFIKERIAQDRTGDSVYLLTDGDYTPVAGNIDKWPNDVQRTANAWMSFEIPRKPDDGRAPVLARARSYTLPEGYSLLVGRNTRELQDFEALIVESLVWALIITGALGMVGGVIMSRNMRSRLDAINRTTQRIISGDLHERVPVRNSGDEFDQLSVNLNNMLQQIDRLMLAMREVSDNIAHDLRSPLTRLKSRLEVTLMSGRDADQYRQALEQSVQETDAILSTFNALLSIAQAEAGASRGEMIPIDLELLVGDVVEMYEPVAEVRGLALTHELAGPAVVRGNRHLMFQAIANLVDNAIKYSRGGGAIAVELRLAGDRVEITIADHGPGIPEADRDRVVQRFVRLEQSRTTPGNGLGLSLVTAVMTLHEGQLELADNHPGLRATLSLPALAPMLPATRAEPARAAG